jgi:D-lactate dehydrogenase
MATLIAPALLRWTDEGRLSVVVDAASCTHGLVSGIAQHLDPELRERYSRLSIIDSVTWFPQISAQWQITAGQPVAGLRLVAALFGMRMGRW